MGEQYDLVFIDANHQANSVFDDIMVGRHAVSPDGLLAGHDFTPYWFETVFATLTAAHVWEVRHARRTGKYMVAEAIVLGYYLHVR